MRPVVCVFLFWLGVAVCSGAGRQVTDSARLASGLAIDLTYPSEAPPKAAQIMVHVSDPDGLDDLTITSVSEDLRYQTNLSGSQPTRELRRVFALTDLFQSDRQYRSPLQIEVTVRNTRGETASARAIIHLKK